MNVYSMRNNEVLVMNVWKVKMVMARRSRVLVRSGLGWPRGILTQAPAVGQANLPGQILNVKRILPYK